MPLRWRVQLQNQSKAAETRGTTGRSTRATIAQHNTATADHYTKPTVRMHRELLLPLRVRVASWNGETEIGFENWTAQAIPP